MTGTDLAPLEATTYTHNCPGPSLFSVARSPTSPLTSSLPSLASPSDVNVDSTIYFYRMTKLNSKGGTADRIFTQRFCVSPLVSLLGLPLEEPPNITRHLRILMNTLRSMPEGPARTRSTTSSPTEEGRDGVAASSLVLGQLSFQLGSLSSPD